MLWLTAKGQSKDKHQILTRLAESGATPGRLFFRPAGRPRFARDPSPPDSDRRRQQLHGGPISRNRLAGRSADRIYDSVSVPAEAAQKYLGTRDRASLAYLFDMTSNSDCLG
jgi:hypothetical protein